MGDGKRQPAGFLWPGLIAVLLLFAGAVFVQVPLHSSRPPEALAPQHVFEHPQEVRARLWEDPFDAVARHRLELDKKGEKPEAPPAREVLRPYLRRTRYALVSGLLASDFVPDDAEHIGYFSFAPPNASYPPASGCAPSPGPACGEAASESSKILSIHIPFEGFVRRTRTADGKQTKERAVLLLWLEEEFFSEHPLVGLNAFFDEFRHEFQCAEPEDDYDAAKLPVKIVGPASSATLEALLQDARFDREGTPEITAPLSAEPCAGPASADPAQRQEAGTFSALRGVEFFSGTATAEIPGPVQQANLLKSPAGPQLIRTTSTDRQLMQRIVDELELRGVKTVCRDQKKCLSAVDPFDHIALISEWDTDYGRKLPEAMASVFHGRCHTLSPALKDRCETVDWIHQFSYLRGIDGNLPKGSKSKSDSSRNGNSNANGTSQQDLEGAEGDSAYDYLRRLSFSLMRTHRELQRTGRAGIRAIGILGSDVYDKLLVLQAVRPYFPQALFFTTDLDARFLHPEEYRWTHNLIVASHFGLELDHSLQTPKSYPPFRDSYQTATFLATRLALEGLTRVKVDEKCPESGIGDLGSELQERSLEPIRDALAPFWQPRVFEIGRTQAVDLSPRKPPEARAAVSDTLCLGARRMSAIHPEPPSWISMSGREIILGLAALGVLLVLSFLLIAKVRAESCAIIRFLRRAVKDHPWWLLSAAVLAGIAVTAANMAIRRDLANGVQEPFYWIEGVSTWPTALIRLLSVLAAAYVLMRSWASITRSQREIGENYFSGEADVTTDPRLDAEPKWSLSRYFGILCRPWRTPVGPCSNLTAGREYLEAGALPKRAYRGAIGSATEHQAAC